MYRTYIGSLGNRIFIRPQYELLENGKYRAIDDRWSEFPNGGTVSIRYSSQSLMDNEMNDLKNRLFKFKIDLNKDFHPEYNLHENNSNKYQINISNIEDFNRDEIIEIVDINCSIHEFLNDKSKRNLIIKHKPNKLLLLRYEQECYGPFEFIITDVERSIGDEVFYTIKVFVNAGVIKKYKESSLSRIILDGLFSIRRSDQFQFIYKLSDLESIEDYEEFDYFDNEELANFLKNLLDKSADIENVAEFKDKFLKIADTFSDNDDLSNHKIKRISEIFQKTLDLNDYKLQITEEYFKNNPKAQKDKEEYIRTHEEMLIDIVRKDSKYYDRKKEIEDELARQEECRKNIEREVQKLESRLNRQKEELDKLGEQAIEQKKKEIDAAISDKKEELDHLCLVIKKESEECEKKKIEHDMWKRYVEQLKLERSSIANDINSKIIEWIAQNRNSEIIRLLSTQIEVPDDTHTVEKLKNNIVDNLTVEQIINLISEKFLQASRPMVKDDILNYLISIVQNYIIVFAGEPGTGKTSMCKILAKALGLYENRFSEVLVERGWTSSKDLMGYYNPLTKEVEKTQPQFFKCMQILDAENKENLVEAPYFVLLDEANLSPIEFYWSHFNYYYDDPTHQIVEYANGEKYQFGDELKFLATINYDQTTADLSPRFIDRAWVISMNNISIENIIQGVSGNNIENNNVIIKWSLLKKLFGWESFSNNKFNQITKTRIDRIVDKMREGGHTVSARSINSIIHYYLVAEEYMTSKEIALDYAVSQKILPSINGNGKKYREFLNGLMEICKENQLNKSASIISKIIERSEHDFYGFFSL